MSGWRAAPDEESVVDALIGIVSRTINRYCTRYPDITDDQIVNALPSISSTADRRKVGK